MSNGQIETIHRLGSKSARVAVSIGIVLLFVFPVNSGAEVSSVLIHQLQVQSARTADTDPLQAAQDVSPTDDSDLFGMSGGYFHPYLDIGWVFTDNLYNVNGNLPVETITQPNGDTFLVPIPDNSDGKHLGQVSNLLTRITPGIWFSLPRTKWVPIQLNTNNTTPGGTRYQLDEFKGSGPYQAYGLLELDFNKYSADSKLDGTDGRAEGFLRYNMSGGLSLQVLDGLTYGQDQLEIGAIYRNDLRRFTSNLFVATADYDMTEKFSVKLEYSNFMLHYDDEINEIFNRVDNSLDVYGYYQYSLKTAVFLEWNMIDVAYTTAEEKNNSQYYLYGGIKWDTTEKLALMGKIGSQTREYGDGEVAEVYDWSGLTYELQTLYRWTVKTNFAFSLYGRSDEANSALATDMQVWGFNLGYHQQLTDRLSGRVNLLFDSTSYNQIIEADRDDKRFLFHPALQYQFRDWASVELAYQYDKRDSSENLFDYTTNTVILNFRFSL